MARIAVIGAGPAGLWAARRAQQAGHDVVVHERADHVGGMAASIDVAGIRADLGSHRLHPSIDPAILAELQRLVALQWRPRNGRIRLLGRWLRFPLRPADVVRHLPPRIAFDALVHDRREREDTYADVVRARFGPAMLEHFYGPYARKLWGLEPDELSGEQARRRISASSPLDLARRALRRQRPGFWYPERGFGAITDALAGGLDIRLGSDVTSLTDVDADHVWSTIPLPALARLAGGDGPETNLRFRALVLVYLVLDRRPWTTFDAHYLPGPETPLSRASEVLNYRDSPHDPTDRTVLCCELPCAVGDEHWTMDDGALGALAARDLGVTTPVTDVVVRRLPAAYPIYDRGFERDLAALEQWLDTRPDVISFGRGGLFAHDNTHHALAEGDAAARCLRPDGSWDADAWRAARARFAAHVVED